MAWYGPRGNCGCCGACDCEIGCLNLSSGSPQSGTICLTELVVTITGISEPFTYWRTNPFFFPTRWYAIELGNLSAIEGTYTFPLGSGLGDPGPGLPKNCWLDAATGFSYSGGFYLRTFSPGGFGNGSITEYADDGFGCPDVAGGAIATALFVPSYTVGIEYFNDTTNVQHDGFITVNNVPTQAGGYVPNSLPFSTSCPTTNFNTCGTTSFNIEGSYVCSGDPCGIHSNTGNGSTFESVV